MDDLHREIGQLKQGNNSISTYYCKLKQLWDEYSSLVVLPSCECATSKQYVEHEQQHKLLQFLLGLNESYSHIRSQVLLMSPLPTIGQAFSIISQEESHRSLLSVEAPPSVFFPNQGKVTNLRKEALKCDYCNWNGHTRKTCYRLGLSRRSGCWIVPTGTSYFANSWRKIRSNPQSRDLVLQLVERFNVLILSTLAIDADAQVSTVCFGLIMFCFELINPSIRVLAAPLSLYW